MELITYFDEGAWNKSFWFYYLIIKLELGQGKQDIEKWLLGIVRDFHVRSSKDFKSKRKMPGYEDLPGEPPYVTTALYLPDNNTVYLGSSIKTGKSLIDRDMKLILHILGSYNTRRTSAGLSSNNLCQNRRKSRSKFVF